MAAEVDICNQALDLVRAAPVVSLSEASANSEACNRLYPQCRDAMLAMHDWRFATARRVLSLLDVTAPKEWLYVYQWPTDCIRARYVEPYVVGATTEYYKDGQIFHPTRQVFGAARFERRQDQIFTDLAQAVLIYTKRITETGAFPPLFTDALAARLAVRLGRAVRADPDLVVQAQQEFLDLYGRATAADANEATDIDDRPAEWIDARA